MSRRRKHNGQRNYARHQLTDAQRLALIPAGASPRSDRLALEQVAVGKNENVLVMRQYVCTKVKKLLAGGMISPTEYAAAVRYSEDYESAFLTSRNPLQSVQVDGDSSAGDIHTAMLHKASAAIRFREIETELGRVVSGILRGIILEDNEIGFRRSFEEIGAERAPDATPRAQYEIGRGRCGLALELLAAAYERLGSRKQRRLRVLS